MPYIFIYVENPGDALETLVYAFKNQMIMGCEKVKLTLKHEDGYSEFAVGKVDDVFLSSAIKEIEYHDVVVLHHSDNFVKSHIIEDVKSLDDLLLKTRNHHEMCAFNVPLDYRNKHVYFVFKNHPMARYRIYRNDIISDKMLTKTGAVLNNIVGRYDLKDGEISYASTLITRQIKCVDCFMQQVKI